MSGAGPSVLVIEGSAESARPLAEQLTIDGYLVEVARSAEHARLLARVRAIGLAILGSLDSPREQLALLGEIRHCPRDAAWEPRLPVIVLGSSAQELDMLRAFEAGADDFLAPPVGYAELRARIAALLRRANPTTDGAEMLDVGRLSIDLRARSVDLGGHTLHLRRLEFELLRQLARDPERVFTRSELLSAVWGYPDEPCTRTLDSHASRLRTKLAAADGGRWVIALRGVGYRLI